MIITTNYLKYLEKNYPPKIIERWKNKLLFHENWARNERQLYLELQKSNQSWRPSEKYINSYFNLVSNIKNAKILDIGCGDGKRAKHFNNHTYFGLDPLIQNKKYDFQFYKGIGEFLPFENDFFDAVISVEVFDHLIDPYKTAEEIIRVLRVGGKIHIFVKDSERAYHQLDSKIKHKFKEEEAHLFNYTNDSLRSIFDKNFGNLEIDFENGYLSLWGELLW